MKFTQEFLDGLGYEDEVEIISEEQVGSSRWNSFHETVFRYRDKFYRYEFTNGLTENQPHERLEPDEEIDCIEVKPKEFTTIRYVPV